jgi:hypothetical protein
MYLKICTVYKKPIAYKKHKTQKKKQHKQTISFLSSQRRVESCFLTYFSSSIFIFFCNAEFSANSVTTKTIFINKYSVRVVSMGLE